MKKEVTKRDRKYGNYSEKEKSRVIKKNKIDSIRKLLESDKLDFAINNIEDYINNYGEDCYIIHEKAKYYFKISKSEEAKKLFYKNINKNSDNMYYSMYEVSKLEKYNKNYDKAISLLIEILNSKHKEKFHAKLELAKIYNEIEEYDKAEQLIYEIINIDEEEYEDKKIIKKYKNLAYEVLFQVKLSINLKEAEELFYSINSEINDDLSKYLQGQIEELKGNFIKAKELFDSLLNSHQYGLQASYQLLQVESDLLNYDRVVEIANSILNRKDKYFYTDTLILLTNIYARKHLFDEASIYLNKLIEENCIDDVLLLTGKMYFYQNDYEKALEYFNKISSENKRLYRESLYRAICCYIKLEKYEEAYSLFSNFKEYNYGVRYANKAKLIQCYLENKLNIESKFIPKLYTEIQIMNYDKNLALEHIKLHEKEDDDKIIHTIFNENICIEDLYEYALDNLDEKYYYHNTFSDSYIVPYKNVGYYEEKIINYIKIITIPNTKQILTIYPYDKFENIYKEKPKQKKMSRIDKFNQKYGYRQDKVK